MALRSATNFFRLFVEVALIGTGGACPIIHGCFRTPSGFSLFEWFTTNVFMIYRADNLK